MPPADSLEAERLRLERQVAELDRLMLVFLLSAAIATVLLGIFLMTTIGGGRAHLPGRLAVAVGALIVLGGVDGHATKLMNRRRPLVAPDTPGFRRFVVFSVIGYMTAAAVLLGVAWLLP